MLMRPMKYLNWTFLGLLVAAGVAITLYFGLQPRSLPKIKNSLLANPERMGEAVAQRLWQEIKEADLILLGVEPGKPDHLKLWKRFLEVLPAEQKYTQVLIEPGLEDKNIISYNEEMDLQKDLDRFKQGLKKAQENKIRVAIIVPSIYSSQSIPDNPVHRLTQDSEFLPLSLSVAEPTLSREEESEAPYPCASGSEDAAGLASWGCLIQTKSRGLYRKKWEPGKYLGLMDQIGEKDYLVLIRKIPLK